MRAGVRFLLVLCATAVCPGRGWVSEVPALPQADRRGRTKIDLWHRDVRSAGDDIAQLLDCAAAQWHDEKSFTAVAWASSRKLHLALNFLLSSDRYRLSMRTDAGLQS